MLPLRGVLTLIVLFLLQKGFTQGESIPPILALRGEESYSFLKENDSLDFFLDELKYVPLSGERAFLSIGGAYRARVEHTSNMNYTF